ncbi:YceI family protein [Alteromonas aestuariivivens]|uniref:YceI family protein n=1 Tax=Alteromonas aestuariivivens TaxID=1938339 RepID=A0A3D8MAQ6_9ALTE|nr:YceI family protein [Alteromonas aestuariivivens]RDV26778.1 YceI family protein [Alteromonas aestuariivivens]
MNKLTLALAALCFTGAANSADYVVDTKGAHASINFKIQHLGYSWLTGRFNEFSGTFSYDEDKPETSSVSISIQTDSVDSNHAERDKHLRGDDFLAVDDYPEAKFVSSSVVPQDDGSMQITGNFTFHGVTKPITIMAYKIGEGEDPWGGYRAGFSGTTSFALKDYGIDYDLGPASQVVELSLHVEGVRQ